MFKFLTTTATITIAATQASADLYQVYFAQSSELGNNSSNYVKIINTNSFTTYDGNMTGFYNRSYAALDAAATAAWGERASGASINDPAAAPITVLDFTGSILKVRSNNGVGIGSNSRDVFFDTVADIDLSNGTVLNEILIAKDQETYDIAVAAGYDVILDTSEIDRSGAVITFNAYSENVTNIASANTETNGGLITGQITGDDGATLFRQEEDGTVHIGENSIVLADELVSVSGNDEVYSSSGVLQLGNNDAHRTVIKGTLEVSNPTQANHAANKSYVDTGDAATLSSAKSYSDTGDAATLSSAKSYSNGIAAMTLAASQISLSADPTSSLNFGIGFGSMGGENAFAFGLGGINQNTNMRYSATASYSDTTRRVAVGAGVSWSLN